MKATCVIVNMFPFNFRDALTLLMEAFVLPQALITSLLCSFLLKRNVLGALGFQKETQSLWDQMGMSKTWTTRRIELSQLIKVAHFVVHSGKAGLLSQYLVERSANR
jgi:hypothetical protein